VRLRGCRVPLTGGLVHPDGGCLGTHAPDPTAPHPDTGPPGEDATKPSHDDATTSDIAAQDKQHNWSTSAAVGLRNLTLQSVMLGCNDPRRVKGRERVERVRAAGVLALQPIGCLGSAFGEASRFASHDPGLQRLDRSHAGLVFLAVSLGQRSPDAERLAARCDSLILSARHRQRGGERVEASGEEPPPSRPGIGDRAQQVDRLFGERQRLVLLSQDARVPGMIVEAASKRGLDRFRCVRTQSPKRVDRHNVGRSASLR
jgi:hypothetical protein